MSWEKCPWILVSKMKCSEVFCPLENVPEMKCSLENVLEKISLDIGVENEMSSGVLVCRK
jgi:hypothetical protein